MACSIWALIGFVVGVVVGIKLGWDACKQVDDEAIKLVSKKIRESR